MDIIPSFDLLDGKLVRLRQGDFEQKTEEKSDVADKPQNFGAWLKGQRMAKKVALEEIAAVTKIHIQQLRSLEDGWEGTMPASAFVRGFVVSYADT